MTRKSSELQLSTVDLLSISLTANAAYTKLSALKVVSKMLRLVKEALKLFVKKHINTGQSFFIDKSGLFTL